MCFYLYVLEHGAIAQAAKALRSRWKQSIEQSTAAPASAPAPVASRVSLGGSQPTPTSVPGPAVVGTPSADKVRQIPAASSNTINTPLNRKSGSIDNVKELDKVPTTPAPALSTKPPQTPVAINTEAAMECDNCPSLGTNPFRFNWPSISLAIEKGINSGPSFLLNYRRNAISMRYMVCGDLLQAAAWEKEIFEETRTAVFNDRKNVFVFGNGYNLASHRSVSTASADNVNLSEMKPGHAEDIVFMQKYLSAVHKGTFSATSSTLSAVPSTTVSTSSGNSQDAEPEV